MTGTDASSSGENCLFAVNSASEQTGWDGVEGGGRTLEEGIEYEKFSAGAEAAGASISGLAGLSIRRRQA